MSFLDVIKCETDNGYFVWKYPKEDFNIGSQLIVHQSQEAIFFLNGKALDLFGPGKHVLTTNNIPILNNIINIPTKGISPFHAEIYFVNKKEQMAIKWGTDSKINYIDPIFNIPLEIGACGEMTLKISDARKLLVKVIGTMTAFTKEDFSMYFKSFLMMHIKSYLAQIMMQKDTSIFDVDSKLQKISADLKLLFAQNFIDYGISLEHFFVTTILKPEDDPFFQRFKQLHFRQYADITEAEIEKKVSIINQETEATKLNIMSKALADKRKTEGYTYQEERKYDTLEKMASNEGIGEFANAGIGLGLISNIAGSVGKELNSAVSVVCDQLPKKNEKTGNTDE